MDDISRLVALSFMKVNDDQDIEVTLTSVESTITVTIKNGAFSKALAYPGNKVVGMVKFTKTPKETA
jgi:hypothetical protein